MQERQSKWYVAIVALSLVTSHLFEFIRYEQFTVSNLFLVLMTTIGILYVLLTDSLKGKTAYHAIRILIFVLVLLAGFYVITKNPGFLTNLYNWCWSYDQTDTTYEAVYAYTIITFFAILLPGIWYRMIRLMWVNLVLSFGYIVLLIYWAVIGYQPGRFTLFVLLSFLLCNTAYLCGTHRTGFGKHVRIKQSLMPVCVIFMFLILMLPSNVEPIQWKLIRRIGTKLSDKFSDISIGYQWRTSGQDGSFSFTGIGYTEDAAFLGGNVSENHSVALRIEAKESETEFPLYLVGTIYDTYTGSSWKREYTDTKQEIAGYHLDYLELALGIGQIPNGVDNRMRNQNYTIHYEGIQTRTIFSMNHTRSIYMLSEDKLSEERNANIFLKSIGKKGTSYRIQGVRLNYQNEEVMDAINRSDTFSYEEVPDKALINLYLSQKNLFSHRIKGSANAIADEMRRLLKKRAEDIKVKDTVLPQELPDRVYELAKEITKDYDTTYDKVKAIEAYVSQYTYTKSPGSVKEGEDFVDAFLFDGKQGYCTYYASAMTILARCIGIPARYVEGYLCKFDEKSGTSYLVRNSSAHAWVEIYFEGIGFLTFEPTSAYQSYCYPTWEVEEKNYEDDEITYEDIHIEKIDRPISQPAIVIEEEAPHTYIGLVIALCCLGGMLVLFFLVVLLLYVRFQKIRRKASPEEQIRLRYLRIELYLKRIGYQRAESETLLSFAQRVEEQVSDCNITYLLLTNLYMEHLYGMTPVTEDVVSDFILYESEIRAKNKGIRRRLTCLFDDLSFMLRA